MGQSLGADWPEWRGPQRDGASTEKNLPRPGRRPARGLPGRRLRRPLGPGRLRQPLLPLEPASAPEDAAQERLLALDADTGKLIWEQRFNVFHTDVPRAPRRVGVAERRPGHGQRLRVRRRRPAARARRRRQGAVAAPAHRGVRRDHDARRPHRVAGHRGRPRDRQHAQRRLGRPRPRRQPLLRVRQEDGRGRLDQLAAAEALRHQLLAADRRDRGRHAPAGRGRQRRHLLRARRPHRASRSGTSSSASARS